MKTFITYRDAALKTARSRAAMAGMLALFAYPHAAEAQNRPDAEALHAIASEHQHLVPADHGHALNALVIPVICPGFLASSSKYYGCLPDQGEVDDVLNPPTGSGVAYYFDSVAGSDANTGFSPAAAKKTLLALLKLTNSSFGTVAPQGSVFYFNRGQNFIGAVNIKNLAGSKYLIGAYGTKNLPRPKFFYQSLDVANAIGFGAILSVAGNGSPVGPTVIQNIDFDCQVTTTLIYTGLTGGTPTLGDTVTCTRTGNTATVSMVPTSQATTIEVQGFQIPAGVSGSAGIQNGDTIGNGTWSATITVTAYSTGFFCNGPTGVTIRNFSVKNSAANGIAPQGLNGTTAANFLMSNGLLQDCQVVYNKGAGIGGGIGTNIVYDHLTAINCGRDGIFSHGIYIIGCFSPSSVTHCYIYGSSDNGITLHGGGAGVNVNDNFMEANGNGMGLGPGSFGTDETVIGGNVLRNIVLNSGTLAPYTGNGFGTGIGLACWVNAIVANNQIIGSATAGLVLSTETNPGGQQNTNVSAYHNTIDSPAGAVVGIYFKFHNTGQSVSYDVRNNINRLASATQFAVVRDAADLISDASITLNNNLHYMPNKVTSQTVGALISWKGTTYTLAAFNAFDATKEATQLYADPQFLSPLMTAVGPNPNGRKFNGLYGQVAAGKIVGANVGVTTDFNGTTRAANNLGCFA